MYDDAIDRIQEAITDALARQVTVIIGGRAEAAALMPVGGAMQILVTADGLVRAEAIEADDPDLHAIIAEAFGVADADAFCGKPA